MKPKNLKCPLRWAERRPLLHEGVFFVPPFYDRHEEWNQFPWEETGRLLAVEYCSGNGDWIIAKALAHPDRLWIAVEKLFCRVRKIWSKCTITA
jgi:tRNA (guanine-N7-)-methyltransferase